MEFKKQGNGFINSTYIKGYFKKYFSYYMFGIAALIAVDIAQTKVPLIIGDTIDGIEQKSIDLSTIKSSIAMLFLIAATMYAGRILWRYFIFGTSRSIERDIRNDMFSHLEKMSAVYYQKHSPGEVMAYMTNDLDAVRMALAQGILTLFDVIALGSITLYNMVTKINLYLTLAAVLPLTLIAITVRFSGKEMFDRFTKRQESYASLSNFVQESLSGIKVIKSFVQEESIINSFAEENKNSYEKNIKLMKLQTVMHPFMQLISGFALAVAVGYGGYLTVNGEITLGSFTAFISFLGMLVWPMIAIGIMINIFSRGSASLARIEEIINEPIEIKDNEHTFHTKSISGEIEIKNLSYKYPGTDNYVLKNINFEIKKGQTLGIIGRTGSGKTTLVNLILRVFEPDKNLIFIDGTDILNIPLHTLRKSIGYVPQDNFLFSETIAENIDFGLKNSPMEDIEKSAIFAAVHDNIKEFKYGYDTLVGERGISLSGGQKQRISIARALIKHPEILILDDAVSAVDTDTEEKILSFLKSERKCKTNIIIAHRISTIQNSDIIIVMDEGEIKEIGTHDQLLKRKGLYSSIYEKQLLEKMLSEQE